MKKIETTVRPIFFGVVTEALRGLGIHVITVSRAETIDRRNAIGEINVVDARSSVRIDAIVSDDLALNARDAIIAVMRGKGRSVGRIAISTVEKVAELGAAERVEEFASTGEAQ